MGKVLLLYDSKNVYIVLLDQTTKETIVYCFDRSDLSSYRRRVTVEEFYCRRGTKILLKQIFQLFFSNGFIVVSEGRNILSNT